VLQAKRRTEGPAEAEGPEKRAINSNEGIENSAKSPNTMPSKTVDTGNRKRERYILFNSSCPKSERATLSREQSNGIKELRRKEAQGGAKIWKTKPQGEERAGSAIQREGG